jgi:hypothetical protein
MKSPEYDSRRDGRIINAECYLHDDKHITIHLMYIEPSEEVKNNSIRFFTGKLTARLLAERLALLVAIPDADDAWLEIARRAASNCDPAELAEQTALELMNPTDEELMAGDQAVQDLVEHLKRMGAAGATKRVPDGAGEWVVNVEWRSLGKVN